MIYRLIKKYYKNDIVICAISVFDKTAPRILNVKLRISQLKKI